MQLLRGVAQGRGRWCRRQTRLRPGRRSSSRRHARARGASAPCDRALSLGAGGRAQQRRAARAAGAAAGRDRPGVRRLEQLSRDGPRRAARGPRGPRDRRVPRGDAAPCPSEIQAWQGLARLLRAPARADEAAIDVLLEGSRQFRTQWNRPQAIHLLRRARAIDPWHFEIVLELALHLGRADQRAEARDAARGPRRSLRRARGCAACAPRSCGRGAGRARAAALAHGLGDPSEHARAGRSSRSPSSRPRPRRWRRSAPVLTIARRRRDASSGDIDSARRRRLPAGFSRGRAARRGRSLRRGLASATQHTKTAAALGIVAVSDSDPTRSSRCSGPAPARRGRARAS